jgi:hypothetical protein
MIADAVLGPYHGKCKIGYSVILQESVCSSNCGVAFSMRTRTYCCYLRAKPIWNIMIVYQNACCFFQGPNYTLFGFDWLALAGSWLALALALASWLWPGLALAMPGSLAGSGSGRLGWRPAWGPPGQQMFINEQRPRHPSVAACPNTQRPSIKELTSSLIGTPTAHTHPVHPLLDSPSFPPMGPPTAVSLGPYSSGRIRAGRVTP